MNVENAASYLDAGASHVVTSYVFRDGALDRERLDGLVSAIGKDRLVLDLSCRKKDDGEYYVVTDRWQKVRPPAGCARASRLRSCRAG